MVATGDIAPSRHHIPHLAPFAKSQSTCCLLKYWSSDFGLSVTARALELVAELSIGDLNSLYAAWLGGGILSRCSQDVRITELAFAFGVSCSNNTKPL